MERLEKEVWQMSAWKIIIEGLAQLDLRDAYTWYENEKPGLGEELFDFFEQAISRIERNPFYASFYDEIYRSASLDKFPYEIIYLTDTTKAQVYIIAITHQHRKPSWFTGRR